MIVRKLIAQCASDIIKPEDIKAEHKLLDILDSLELLDLAFDIETHTGVALAEDFYETIITVRDLEDHVADHAKPAF